MASRKRLTSSNCRTCCIRCSEKREANTKARSKSSAKVVTRSRSGESFYPKVDRPALMASKPRNVLRALQTMGYEPGRLQTQYARAFVTSLFREIEREYGITKEQIKSKSRKKKIVEARKVMCFRLKDWGFSNPAAGSVVNRHWTTVIGYRREHG